MDDTASFSSRSNAKRAAEQMISKATAPALDYGIKARDNGRFEIVWKTAEAKASPTTSEMETEIATACDEADAMWARAGFDPAAEALAKTKHKDWLRNQAAASATADEAAALGKSVPVAAEPAPQPKAERTSTTEMAETEPASTEPATAEPEPQADQFPAGTYVQVRQGKRKVREGHISHRIDEQHWRVRLLGASEEVTILVNAAQLYRAEEPEPAPEAKAVKRQRRGQTTATQPTSRSRYAIDPEAIAAGRLPEKAPVVTSTANPHYQKHFDRLFGLAKAGDWDAVRNYKVTGSNSYSKMVARYREDLLTLHAASEAAQ